MSTLYVDSIQPKTTGSQLIIAPAIQTGAMLQTQFTQYTGTTSVSISTDTNTVIDVLTVNITPKSTSSIIKLDAHIFHEWANSSSPNNSVWFFYRDSIKLAHAQVGTALCGITNTLISYSTDGSSTPEIANYSYFDTPSTTNTITYKVAAINNANTTIFINKNNSASTTSEYERGISFISATEIGG
jgi:hypothetical protein